ncbi:hypothetical protein [Limosilactobacillus mucosae]|uniref:hypothetical protein n=1 Tax=Limosilactobacillus mucosae TaxID=97478 RepID=UPI00233EA51F|nr:hypothetical protein [Limosilactobacillus mucosae]MDC2842215.1 hypothetical protein [Limosilactobacillus mucosae]
MNSKTILKNNRAAGLIILTIGLLLTGQMITGHGIVGADSVFHYNRFYETYSQLKHLNFSWFQSIYGFNQSGRIVNVVYGPLFAYLNGGLLLLAHSWYQYQIVSSIIIYLIGGFGMYRLLKRLSIRPIIAAMMASFYLTVGWMPRWQIGNNTTALGAMLMPYLLMITFDMITDANRPIHWKKLTLLMSLTIEIHLLSALLFMLVLIPAWLYALKIANDKTQMLLDTVKAVLTVIVLTANTLVPLIYLSLTNHLAMPAEFDVIKNTLRLDSLNNTHTTITVFLLGILILQMMLAILNWRHDRLNLTVTLLGAIFLGISSRFFCWSIIVSHFPIVSRLLQFPVRLMMLAYPLLIVGLARSFETISSLPGKNRFFNQRRLSVGVLSVIWLVCLAQAGLFINQKARIGFMPRVLSSKTTSIGKNNNQNDQRNVLKAMHASDYQTFLKQLQKRVPDYLATTKANVNAMQVAYSYGASVVDQKSAIKIQAVSHGRLKLTWQADGGEKIQLPIVTYHQSRLIVNGKNMTHFKRSLIGSPTIAQKPGHNTAYLSYAAPLWLNALIIISLLSWLAWALRTVVSHRYFKTYDHFVSKDELTVRSYP